MIPQIIMCTLIAINLLVASRNSQEIFVANFIGQIIMSVLLITGGFFHCWNIG